MSSKRSAPPLQIDLVPSRLLLFLLSLMHGGAFVLSMFFDSPGWIKGFISVSIMASLVIGLHKTGWMGSLPTRLRLLSWQFMPVVVWRSDNTWQVFTQDGRRVPALLLPNSTCHAAFVALNFRSEQRRWWDRRFSVVIFPDAIDQEIFRQLRVRLRTRFDRELDN